VAAVFNTRGRLAMIAGAARGDVAGGIRPGDRARSLRRHGRRIAGGLWAGRRLGAGRRAVYGVRGGRVRFVGVATAAEVRSARRLRADVHAAGL
jgi:hypothetical protein